MQENSRAARPAGDWFGRSPYLTRTAPAASLAFALLLFPLLAAKPAAAETICPPGVRACPPEPELVSIDYGKGPSFDGDLWVDIVKNKQALIALGKALFWDQRAGSDGNACASCHFHGGADVRLRNQMSPGLNNIALDKDGNGVDTTEVSFGVTRSDTGKAVVGSMPSAPTIAPVGANHLLKPGDMPIHKLSNEDKRDSPVDWTTDDRVSSQGAFDAVLTKVKKKKDKCDPVDGAFKTAHGYFARQVEPRNTPTMINAIYFHRNFWDGRANNVFNGVGVFGRRDIKGDPNARLLYNDAGGLKLTFLELVNASLASQAVGPPLSELEMSCSGRDFAEVGKKLLNTAIRPLQDQKVAATDSVLKTYRHASGKGLTGDYFTLVKAAFAEKWWNKPGFYLIENGQLTTIAQTGNKRPKTGFTQAEMNFSMFWGVAIMAYEATLISDKSKFDEMLDANRIVVGAPGNPNGCTGTVAAANATEQAIVRGCTVFTGLPPIPPFPAVSGGGGCIFCHTAGAAPKGLHLFSDATAVSGQPFVPFAPPVPASTIAGRPMVNDQGFHVIGVKPWWTDAGLGGSDKYNAPLSYVRQLKNGNNPDDIDGTGVDVTHIGVDGGMKTPSMRNIALTPPYFHWGGYADLAQVIKFYNRGGNRRAFNDPGDIYDDKDKDTDADGTPDLACTSGDDSGSGPNGNTPLGVLRTTTETNCNSNASFAINELLLTPEQVADLTAFLKSLTDNRVQCRKAPFDHPELTITNGNKDEERAAADGKAKDIKVTLPAVGAGGTTCFAASGNLFQEAAYLK
jgi:cytochrome c peroxidase